MLRQQLAVLRRQIDRPALNDDGTMPPLRHRDEYRDCEGLAFHVFAATTLSVRSDSDDLPNCGQLPFDTARPRSGSRPVRPHGCKTLWVVKANSRSAIKR